MRKTIYIIAILSVFVFLPNAAFSGRGHLGGETSKRDYETNASKENGCQCHDESLHKNEDRCECPKEPDKVDDSKNPKSKHGKHRH